VIGENGLSVRLDYLAGTLEREHLPAIRNVLRGYSGDAERVMASPWSGYQSGVEIGEGAFLLWSELEPKPRPECNAIFKGSCLSRMTLEDQMCLCQDLIGIGRSGDWDFKATRIDIALDDFTKRIRPSAIDDEIRAGRLNYYPQRAGRFVRDRRTGGGTYNIGVRGSGGSGCSLCIYDKDIESGGLIDAVRFECRLCKNMAASALLYILDNVSVERFEAKMAEVVGGCVDFYEVSGNVRDAKGNGHTADRKAVAWWAEIRDQIGSRKFRAPAKGSTGWKDMESWMRLSVAGTLYALVERARVLGGDRSAAGFIESLLAHGSRRIPDRLANMLAALRPPPEPSSGALPF
jgi:hypothetical protein